MDVDCEERGELSSWVLMRMNEEKNRYVAGWKDIGRERDFPSLELRDRYTGILWTTLSCTFTVVFIHAFEYPNVSQSSALRKFASNSQALHE